MRTCQEVIGNKSLPHTLQSTDDCNNKIGRERKKYLESNDAQTLCTYLKNKQLEDPAFFYAIDIDKESGRIANFFWADGQSIMDYACFGDAVSFDTTFQTNKFAFCSNHRYEPSQANNYF